MDLVSTTLQSTSLEAATHLVLLGDVHDQWNRVQAIMDQEFPDGNGVALCVGDLVTYQPLQNSHQIYFIPGNHENFRRLTAVRQGTETLPSATPLFAGDILRIGGLTVAGLPGVYSPYLYDRPSSGEASKYFSSEDIRVLESLDSAISGGLDILMTHEAPFGIGFQKAGKDLGRQPITDLIRRLRPRVSLFGHHHMDFEGGYETTRVLGLNYPKRSYSVLDIDQGASTIRLRQVAAALTQVHRGAAEFVYAWQTLPGQTSEAPRAIKEGARVLFGGDIPLDRTERLTQILEGHRPRIEKEMMRVLSAAPGSPSLQIVEMRTVGAMNTAQPFATRYAAAIEADPKLPETERRSLMDRLGREMTAGLPAGSVNDVLLAFQKFLQALNLIPSSAAPVA